jgi:hypothetical protein
MNLVAIASPYPHPQFSEDEFLAHLEAVCSFCKTALTDSQGTVAIEWLGHPHALLLHPRCARLAGEALLRLGEAGGESLEADPTTGDGVPYGLLTPMAL